MGRTSVYDILSTKYFTRVSKKRNNSPENGQLLMCSWFMGLNTNTSGPFDVPRPGKLTFPMSGETLSLASSGAIDYRNAPSGYYNYVVNLHRATSANADFYLGVIDMLWANSGIDLTGTGYAQIVNSVPWPARDDSGLATGYGVYAAILVGNTTSQASQFTDLTISYTNTNGVADRTGTLFLFPATAQPCTFLPITLDQGDLGVKSIQSITIPQRLVATTTGSIHLVAYRPIVMGASLASASTIDFYSIGATKIHNDSCLSLILSNNLNAQFSYNIELVTGP
jgi:hypothetical protein